MTPRLGTNRRYRSLVDRRQAICALGMLVLTGCSSPLMRSQSPESDAAPISDEEEGGLRLVGDETIPVGMNFEKIEGPALVNCLRHTGSDPPPSPLRMALIGEMQSHDVPHPEQFLESDENSLVVARVYLPPGVQKGDRLDVEVVTPPKSKTASLRGGILFPARLRKRRVMDDGSVRSGHISGLAGGTVVVDSVFYGTDDAVDEIRGRVLGGGQSQISRPLGLAVRPEFSVKKAARIGSAINARFYKSDRNGKSGVATPKRDNYVELAVHPRYRHNLSRYMRVVRAIALQETPGERVVRIQSLKGQLLDPVTSARAAIQLEAIGEDAVLVLKEGLNSSDLEVRFYAAEALAYLDIADAAPVLADTALRESAFRWHALTALSAMDHVQAYEALNELLHVTSAETRYGAFRALRTRNAADPLVRGESLGGEFAFHLISSTGPEMIHISKAQRAEIVLFGPDQRLVPPAFLFAGKDIMVKGLADGRLKLTRFDQPDDESSVRYCESTVNELIRSVVEMGASYSDVIEMLQEARKGGYLSGRLVVNALARPNREYHGEGGDGAEESSIRAANPVPELFSDRLEQQEPKARHLPEEIESEELEEKEESEESFLGRMTGWFRR